MRSDSGEPFPGAVPGRSRRPARNAQEVYAALDLGTNNCRMLVAEPWGAGFRVIDSYSRITRLGEGLHATGALCDAAIRRTIWALKSCAAKMARRGVGCARLVATEACRRAANCAVFAERVARETGLDLEIISAEEEAALALAGCASLLDEDVPQALVFDIGGGSTELIWVRRKPGTDAMPDVVGVASLPLGVVTLSERYGGRQHESAGYHALVAEVEAALASFEAAHGLRRAIASGRVQMLGTSGTVTTLGGVHLGLKRYDRARVDGLVMDFEAVRTVSRYLRSLDDAGRMRHPCIGRARADLVVSGCAILEAICAVWPVGRLRVADRGVREGVLLQLMNANASRAVPRPVFPTVRRAAE